MLVQLILKKQKPAQLLLAVFGAVFGMLLLLGSFQVYEDIRAVLNGGDDMLSSHYVVVNKEVSVFNTLALASTEFSDQEMEKIKAQPFTESLGEFKAGLFSAKAFIDPNESPDFPPLYTDLFFEALPNAFIDIKPSDWNWKEGDNTVPIIVPSDYMNMYNFGFAPSQGLPQLSKKTVSLASFKIKISGNGKEEVLKAHVAGFSNRINTILVPGAFLDYANAAFGTKARKKPSRLIISTKDPSSPELQQFLADNGYETNEENLKNSKLNSLLRIIVNICLGIGGVIIVMSLLSFVQYSQLIINRSVYELQTLIKLGYNYTLLWQKYFLFYLFVFVFVFILALTGLHYGKSFFITLMAGKGFEIEAGLSANVCYTGVVLACVLLAFNAVSVFLSLRNLAKMKWRD